MILVGEAGEDTGGLRREFWRIFVHAAATKYFIGSNDIMTFQQNILALQVYDYCYVLNMCMLCMYWYRLIFV